MVSDPYPTPARRRLITLCVMMAAVMNQIDITIANGALPHMQGTTSASREAIVWVLTAYIAASAIAMPPNRAVGIFYRPFPPIRKNLSVGFTGLPGGFIAKIAKIL